MPTFTYSTTSADGTTTVFAFAAAIGASDLLYAGGQLMHRGIDWSASGSNATIFFPPAVGTQVGILRIT